LYASWEYAFTFEKPEVAASYLEQALNIDDQEFGTHRLLAITYFMAKDYNKSVIEFEKCFEIFSRLDKNYLTDYPNYGYHGFALHRSSQYKKEKKFWDMAEKYQPESPWMLTGQAVLAFTEKDTVKANSYIEKYKAYEKKNSQSEAATDQGLGDIYWQSGMLEKADEYYQKALTLEPSNVGLMKAVSDYYIQFKRNLNEVPELMDIAMKIVKNRTDYYNYMDTKGWAYYKMGKNKEALAILQKVWDEAPYKIYTIRSHYEEVKKAVAGQN
jgi:tetratricopeptide (TPR) repeat protein